jgi:Zn-dependent protease with chaperone function
VSFLFLGSVVALASFAVAVGATSIFSQLLARGLLAHDARDARTLLAWRLLPVLFAAGLTLGMVMPAYLAFEPAAAGTPGPAILLVATAGATLLAAGAVRLVASVMATRRLLAEWRRGTPIVLPGSTLPALVVDHAFPVVAVLGLLRPRLIVARGLLQALTTAELAAVVRHEMAHVSNRDNLKMLLLRGLPDLIGRTRTGRRLETALRAAMEREADEAAARTDTDAVDLASALVKVAHLAIHAVPPAALAPALHDGAPLAARVQRLVDPARGVPPARALVVVVLAVAAAPSVLLASPAALHAVHLGIEWAVHLLR